MSLAPDHPTLEQVAARAGVGRGTASRVINGSSHVSDHARNAVERAVRELGYIPNQAARTLKTRRTGAVALVVSETEDRVFGEPFFATLIRGISAATGDAGYQLLLALVRGQEEASREHPFLSPQHVDGALMVSQHDDDPLPHALAARGLPLVFAGRVPDTLEASSVDVDNVGGAESAVAHLVAAGRRTIATIAGPDDMTAGRDRAAGYRSGLGRHDLPVDPHLVATADFSEAGGEQAMARLLEARPDLDAVFVASDLMAVGAVRALQAAGRRVPDDVAVVGFDDAPVAGLTDPALTTVHQPVDELGRRMAGVLVDQVLTGGGHSAVHEVLPTRLVVRASG
ncbi:LacI family DNA-binding transcriptional regulator [Solicola sp. PLA-1-18]|uniref:LacI family DNA-binding transcriptional regulator n=1 Tax=Solicola sp. PLA-1-18 TaxID=3380532 RepID=UPI003B7D7FFF